MNYAISDIHGMFDKLIFLLEKIIFLDTDELYIIGDVIDRGDKPLEILEYIMSKPNIHLLKGNHEYNMMSWYDAYMQRKMYPYELIEAKLVWMQNSGNVTLKQFQKLPREKQIQIIKYLRKCPYYLVIDKFILCHAGIRIDEKYENLSVEEILKHQSVDDLLNNRGHFYNHKAIDGYTIIFGHTPNDFIRKERNEPFSLPLSIWHDKTFNDKICIDCGAVFESDGGRLACLRLDDMKEFYA
jgi:serine/threonine protein phosphatase 1